MTKPTRTNGSVIAILCCLLGPTVISYAQEQVQEEQQPVDRPLPQTDQEKKEEKRANSYDGNWELGVFVPYSHFDTGAPVRDLMGVDDKLRDTYGRGMDLAYNFTRHHAIETNNSWVDTDSEDQRGANHFSVRTRYNLLNYRLTMWWGPRWAPFLTLGAGAFRARALEENHVSFGGRVLTAGAGLRFFLSHRSSSFLMVQAARINLNPDDATNYVIMWGITAHIGKGPGSFEPPPDADKN